MVNYHTSTLLESSEHVFELIRYIFLQKSMLPHPTGRAQGPTFSRISVMCRVPFVSTDWAEWYYCIIHAYGSKNVTDMGKTRL